MNGYAEIAVFTLTVRNGDAMMIADFQEGSI